jgi:hypothetical protein
VSTYTPSDPDDADDLRCVTTQTCHSLPHRSRPARRHRRRRRGYSRARAGATHGCPASVYGVQAGKLIYRAYDQNGKSGSDQSERGLTQSKLPYTPISFTGRFGGAGDPTTWLNDYAGRLAGGVDLVGINQQWGNAMLLRHKNSVNHGATLTAEIMSGRPAVGRPGRASATERRVGALRPRCRRTEDKPMLDQVVRGERVFREVSPMKQHTAPGANGRGT